MKAYIGPFIKEFHCKIHHKYMTRKYGLCYGENKTKTDTYVEMLDDALQWIYNNGWNRFARKFKRKIKVKVHDYDVWSVNSTIAYLVVPLMEKYAIEAKESLFFVYNKDLPDNLKFLDSDGGFGQEANQYIIGEIIYAFKTYSEELEVKTIEEEKRVENGLMLFAKYYPTLWT